MVKKKMAAAPGPKGRNKNFVSVLFALTVKIGRRRSQRRNREGKDWGVLDADRVGNSFVRQKAKWDFSFSLLKEICGSRVLSEMPVFEKISLFCRSCGNYCFGSLL